MATALLVVLLVLMALLLALAEVIIPSWGLISLLAGAAIIGASVLAFREGALWGWLTIGSFVALLPVAIWGGFKLLPHTPVMLKSRIDGQAREKDLSQLAGSRGIAVTQLRPGGRVRLDLDGRVYEATSQSLLIQRGTAVVVVETRSGELVVRPVNEDSRA